MGVIRTATLPARPEPLANVTIADQPAGRQLFGLLNDRRTTLWSDYSTVLLSRDNGVTTSFVGSFNDGNWYPQAYLETADGELLIGVHRGGGYPDELWRSTGLNKTTGATTAWTKVLTAAGPDVEFRGVWSLNQFALAPSWSRHAGAIFASEYGTRIDQAPDDADAARHVYMSTDDGLTWRAIFDLAESWPGDTRLHVHSVAYDPWAGRVVVSHGDGGGDTPGHCGVWWSDDFDGDDPTWNLIEGSGTSTAVHQLTTVIPTETGIVLLPDATPWVVHVIPRRGLLGYGPLRQAARISAYNAEFIGGHAYRAGGLENPLQGAPLLLTCRMPTGSPVFPAIYGTTDGLTFRELWRHNAVVTNGSPGFDYLFGPTVDGKIIGRFNAGAGGKLFTADYVPTAGA